MAIVYAMLIGALAGFCVGSELTRRLVWARATQISGRCFADLYALVKARKSIDIGPEIGQVLGRRNVR